MIPDFDPLGQRYPSARLPVYARNGMVNCSNPQAAAAGLEALRQGGNAVDAAVAAASCLTVTEPTANGIGGDAFAIVWIEKEKRLYGLNASGPAPRLASIGHLRADGKDEGGKMPRFGWTPVTVPGAPKAWAALVKRFGKRTLAEDLAPAVRYAREGYPCSANLGLMWQRAYDAYKPRRDDPAFTAWFGTFAPDGRGPRAGEMIYLPGHAKTLEAIGETDAAAFYSGRLAEKIDEQSRLFGGYLRAEDLEAFEPEWVEPISVNYRGYDVFEIPPNGQGIVALMALNILKEFELTEEETAETCHRKIEAVKMAFADAFATVTDPRHAGTDFSLFLDPAYGAARAKEMTGRAQDYGPCDPPKSGTVYLACGDGEGNLVSFIQSNYNGFGSGIVIGGTGIALQNRGADFSLDPGHVNCLKPGKRTYHTIIPGFLMKDGKPVGPFGVMGGYMQPQGHVQVVTDLIDRRLGPQQSLDAPRWQWMRDGRVAVEKSFDQDITDALRRMGHEVFIEQNAAPFGRGQIIFRLENGVLVGGTEPRTDSSIACC